MLLSKKRILLTVLISFAIFCILELTIFQIPPTQLFLFLFCQLVLILIPGLAIATALKTEIPFVSFCCLGYALGYAVNIFEYFILKYLNSPICNYLLPFTILTISIFIILKNKNFLKKSFQKVTDSDQVVTLAFIIGLLFLNFFVYSLDNINIYSCHRDLLWWCQNTVALKLNFPPENIYMSGTNLFYHYFSNIQIAFFNLVSGIDIKTLSIPFYSLTKTIIMVSAVDFALTTLKLTDTRIKIIGLLLVLFTTGLENFACLTYFHHIMKLPFGFDIGYAFGLLYTSLLVKQFYSNSFNAKLFIPAIMFWFVCCGAKAPIALVLLIFSVLICLYWLIKKSYKLSFIYGVAILLIFLYVSYTFVGVGSVVDGSSNSWSLSFHHLSYYNKYPLFAIIIMISKILAANITLTISTIIALLLLKDISKSSKQDSKDFWILLMTATATIIGLLLWMLLLHIGHSEMYYGMASFITAYFFIAITYKITIKNLSIISNKKLFVYKILFKIALIVGIMLFAFGSYDRSGAIRTLFKSLDNINEQEKTENIKPLLWLRDNSALKSLILADNFNDNSYYTYGILTERRQYLEEDYILSNSNDKLNKEVKRRKDFINSVFSNDNSALKNLKKEGIDYVISTKEISSNFIPDEKYLKLITLNDKFRVYKVK